MINEVQVHRADGDIVENHNNQCRENRVQRNTFLYIVIVYILYVCEISVAPNALIV